MFNDLMEAWVDELVPDGFRGLIIERRVGMPTTVRLEADFRAIGRAEAIWSRWNSKSSASATSR